MANPDILDADVRRKIIIEIKGPENVARKLNEQRKFDIYRKRQAGYVVEKLLAEFDQKTVKSMRKVLSINPCKRIIDEQSSLYVEEPERHWVDVSSDDEKEQLKEIYECGRVDPQMRLANRYFKLHGQSALYVIPKHGVIGPRALTPKDYDVIPDEEDPELAFAYVLNVFDPASHQNTSSQGAMDWSDNRFSNGGRYAQTDGKNQTIADENDKKMRERYVFWTKEWHLTCDGLGQLVEGMAVEPNPIEKLPFVDIHNEKDFNFFVQLGSDVAEFVIDLLTQLSDLANTTRMQNYSQAVIASVNQPTNVMVGPNKILWLQIDPNADQGTRPEFQFISPTPDIMGSLELINVQLKMFLSSHGLNPGTVSGKNEVEKFTSGIDHLLANLDKFKASKEDMDIFRQAEKELFSLMTAWHSVMFDVTDDTALKDELKQVRLSEDISVDVAFKEPQAVQTQTEIEDSVIKLTGSGLMTKVEAVMRVYGVEKDRAEEIVAELDAEKAANKAMGLGPDGLPIPVQIDPQTGLPMEHQPAELGPDGKPVDQKLGPDGKPLEAKLGPDGKPLQVKGKMPFGKDAVKPGEEPVVDPADEKKKEKPKGKKPFPFKGKK